MQRRSSDQAGRTEAGSALTEAALVVPVLVMLLYWSAAVTDVMLLRIKGQEAARFATWEMTVFRDPQQVKTDLQSRFADLRSPAGENRSFTGLVLYPRASSLTWTAVIDPRAKQVGLGGTVDLKSLPGTGLILRWINQMFSFLSRSVDAAVRRERFNVFGYAEVRVSLSATHEGSAILNGGDLPLQKDGASLPSDLQTLRLSTPRDQPGLKENPMRLVFDTWRAWPKPAAFTADGAPSDTGVAPKETYRVVEEQVSAQVDKITFFGLNQLGLVGKIRGLLVKLTSSGFMKAIMGGQLPDVFSSARMDAPGTPNVGPLTIRPVEVPDVSWAPGHGLAPTRLGGEPSHGTAPVTGDQQYELTGQVDKSRYTVPYKINTRYWTKDGGASADTLSAAVTTVKSSLALQNEYVKAWACRGHYFAGSQRPQVTDPKLRYQPSCANR